MLEFWNDIMEIPEARWVVWLSILAIALLAAFYIGKKFRDMAFGQSGDSPNLISEFEQLKREGKLDESEFAKLKSTLSNQIVSKESLKEKDDD